MLKLTRFSAIVLILLSSLQLACEGNATKKSEPVDLTMEELAWFAPYHPTAVTKIVHTIPDALLLELDITVGNTTFWSLHDAEGTLLAYARQIADPLVCGSGKCKAIRFFLLFDPQVRYTHIFHPAGKSGDFYKGIEGDPDNDELFTAADWEFLRALLLNPPTKLVEAESTDVIVDAVSTATYENYWDVVIRQAAYTTHIVLHHLLRSVDLIQSQISE